VLGGGSTDPVTTPYADSGPGRLVRRALHLARYNLSVLVFDTGHGRSTHHQTKHNYLGFPHGIAITRLRELTRQQLMRYPQVTVMDHVILGVSGDG
jgi:thioredoxin reductase (NADPH)